jgi:hypothetical protein
MGISRWFSLDLGEYLFNSNENPKIFPRFLVQRLLFLKTTFLNMDNRPPLTQISAAAFAAKFQSKRGK